MLPFGYAPSGDLYSPVSFQVKLHFCQGKAPFSQGKGIFYVLSTKAHAQKTIIRRKLSPAALAETHSLAAVFIVPVAPVYYIPSAAIRALFRHKINLFNVRYI
jgi:hypothetical protein